MKDDLPEVARAVREKSMARWIAGTLVVLTLALYWPVTRHDFVNFDDAVYVTTNTMVQAGCSWSGLWWACTANEACNWHPLTWLGHMLMCDCFGLNAGAHHFLNVCLHAATTVLLFLLWRWITGALWPSAWLAAVFAWHPLHVESVAWIAELKDTLSALFWVLCLWLYVRYTLHTSLARLTTLLLVFALGLMAKPMLVTLPPVLLVLDYWPLRRWRGAGGALAAWPLVREKIPLFLLTLLLCGVTLWAQHGAITGVSELPFLARLTNALTAYAHYLMAFLWPHDLCVLYPLDPQSSGWQTVGATLLLLALTILVLRRSQAWPWALVGWLWFLGTLVPVAGLIQVGTQARADRYMYVPSIGLSIMLAYGIPFWTRHKSWQRLGVSLAAVLSLGACLLLTGLQLHYWQNTLTLFQHALAVNEHNGIAHQLVGEELWRSGNHHAATLHFKAALRDGPDRDLAAYNLGNMLFAQGQYAEAVACYDKALQVNPRFSEAHNNLGVALQAMHRTAEALQHFQEALRLKPSNADAANNLRNVAQPSPPPTR